MLGSASRFSCYLCRQHDTRLAISRSFCRYQSTQHPAKQDGSLENISGIYYVPRPSITKHASMVGKLPELEQPVSKNLTNAIFFATPGIAKWFAPGNDFLRAAINQIYPSVLEEAPLTSIVAIVEALPIPHLGQTQNDHQVVPFQGAEGLGFCCLSEVSTILAQAGDSNKLPFVRFYSDTRDDDNGVQNTVSASVQVANTLFINGSMSTVLRQNWKATGTPRDRRWEADGPPQQLSQISIPIHRSPSSFLEYDARLRFMTKPRKVVSSMGNVVREIESDDGSVMKASTELETVVPKFLKDKSSELGDGRVEVYALLMPPFSDNSVGNDKPESQENQPSEDLLQKAEMDQRNKIGGLISKALRDGGRLHKVTGGGGGWGKKAGLLSLDTTTNFESDSGFHIGMFPSFDDKGGMTSKSVDSEEAIPSGWSVQFLAVFVGASQNPYKILSKPDIPDENHWTSNRWTRQKNNLLVLGTTDAKDEQLAADEAQGLEGLRKIIPVHRIFGMLSPGGIWLSKEKTTKTVDSSPDVVDSVQKKLSQFRVDAPHTRFWAKYSGSPTKQDKTRAEGVTPSNTDSNSGGEELSEMGMLINDALKQSRKPIFRKVKFQPTHDLEVSKSLKRRLARAAQAAAQAAIERELMQAKRKALQRAAQEVAQNTTEGAAEPRLRIRKIVVDDKLGPASRPVPLPTGDDVADKGGSSDTG